MISVGNYHYISENFNYISENFNSKYPSIFGVTRQQFKNQLLLLKDKGDFVHPKDLILNYNEILNSEENFFFITYDDGSKEQYQFALSIVDELNIPAIFFANSKNFQEKKVSNVHKIHLLRSLISTKKFINELDKFGILINKSNFQKLIIKIDFFF